MTGERSDSGDRGETSQRAAGGDRGGHPCPLCETPMFKRHCKYVCPQHGVVVDCSDPFSF